MLWLAGCANHADFVELRDHLSTGRSLRSKIKSLDALQRRLESLERAKIANPPAEGRSGSSMNCLHDQRLESRLAKPDDTLSIPVSQVEPLKSIPLVPPNHRSRPPRRCADDDARSPTITPTSRSIWRTTTISTEIRSCRAGFHHL